MKRVENLVVLSVACLSVPLASSADQSLASTLNVYVFPKDGQSSSQQSTDESDCYQWAVSNSGVDPFQLQKQEQAQQQQAQQQAQAAQQVGQGSGATGAVKGAAAGALVGAIGGNDVGNAAGWGAAAGLIHGRRKGRRAREQAEQQAQQQDASAQQQNQTSEDRFNKAFSVCLEGKNYMVKY